MNLLGIVKYEAMILRIARKYERSIVKGKPLKPYKIIIEDTTNDEDSEFESTSDENDFNRRKSDTSTDTEMTVKDYIRKSKMLDRKIKKWEKDARV